MIFDIDKFEDKTAKEYFKKHLSGEPLHQDVVIEAMIEFAKYHVEQALLKAEEEVDAGLSYVYPLENIK